MLVKSIHLIVTVTWHGYCLYMVFSLYVVCILLMQAYWSLLPPAYFTTAVDYCMFISTVSGMFSTTSCMHSVDLLYLICVLSVLQAIRAIGEHQPSLHRSNP